MEPFRISNSKLQSWETMCPIEFKAKYIDKTIEFVPTIEMEWGNLFETLVIGGGIGGAFSFDKSPHGKKMINSDYRARVEEQAELCKGYLKAFGGKVLSRQEYIQSEVTDASGTIIPIEGTLDIRYKLKDGRMAVIDLKFTGDTENDFGKFAWGSPEKMDLSQIKHYPLLTKLKYLLEYIPEGYYWVFDKGVDMKKKLIKCNISESAMHDHIERLSEAWNEITMAIVMNDWTPKNTWENCSKCKAKCNFERVMPEIIEIDL